MLIEYKIEFGREGVTISQRVQPGGLAGVSVQAETTESSPAIAAARALPEVYTPPSAAASERGGEADRTDTGGSRPSSVVIVLGPVVAGCPCCHKEPHRESGK